MTFRFPRFGCIVALLLAISQKSATAAFQHNVQTTSKVPTKQAFTIPMMEAAVVLSLTFGTMGPAYAASIGGNLEQGQELFTNNCASCHAGGMNVMKEKKTLRKDALEKFVGLDEEKVKAFVQESGQHKRLIFPKVPGGKFTDDAYADVVTYIVDQATGDKW